jgi:flagellar protein FlgJ
MYNAVYQAALDAGAPNPAALAAVGAAQTSLETGYGKHMVGNNAFGIKGSGPAGSKTAKTWEVRGGKRTTESAKFRAYNSPEQSAADWVNLMKSKSRYSGVWNAPDAASAIAAQAKSGYATDPNYGSKLKSITVRAGLY